MTRPELSAVADPSRSLIDQVSDAAWDQLVDAQPEGSFCHLAGWRSVIEDTIGHECLYRAVVDDAGNYVGALPLVRIRNRLFGDHLLSMPFLNYGGAVGSPAAREQLTRWAIAEAKRLRVDSLLLRTRHETPGGFETSTSKVTMVLQMPATSDEMWNKRLNAKFRNKIKRPQRDGMATKFGTDQLDAFYEVFAINMRDLGTPVLPRQFFERIIAQFPDLVVMGVTYWNGRAVAGGFGFRWHTEFEMTWSASLRELRAQKPNMLLYWDYMVELTSIGIRAFNFGRSTVGTGTYEFKQSWGAVDEPLPWIQVPPNPSAREGRAAELAATVWRFVPLPIANSVGPWLARRLPWW